MFLGYTVLKIKLVFSAVPSVIGLTHQPPMARSVTLSWQRPDTRCIVTSYYISYSGTPMWGHHQPHEGSVQLILMKDNYIVTYELKKLLPYSNYSIQVLAENETANGTQVYIHGVRTVEAGRE